MTPYIAMYGYLVALLFIKADRYLFIILFFSLSFFLTLSYTNGIDWTSYQSSYEFSPYDTRGIEFGYTALVLIAKTFGLNFEFFKFFILSFNLFVILRFVFNYSVKPIFVVLILFQTHLLGNFFEPAIRQLQAVIIFIFAFRYLLNRENLKFYFSVLLGSLFHQSMLVLFLLPFILKHINFRMVVVVTLLGAILSPMFDALMRLAVVIPMFKDYAFYLGSTYFEGIDASPFNIAKTIIYALPFYLLRNHRTNEPVISLLRGLGFLFLICYILQFFLLIFYRFNHYFIIFYVVYISLIFDMYRKNIFRYMFFVFYVFIHFISLIKGVEYFRERDSMKYFPYTNYFIEYVQGNTYDNVQDKIDVRLTSRWKDQSKSL
ncbi:EpsG family protein [Moritella sp. 28]|uniref:EpsG family protein n=1 Tax=Moritella sp. 28 TaxID=2746232 RepID=UPI001BA8CEB0|nr:EpsG family protein [Moritella sp. 28]QUM83590.1 EpsG family protein [Moritella sp. 28]